MNEILHQITYKMLKIQKSVEVAYPPAVQNIVAIFTNKYEKKIDKKAIANEITRKLKFDDSFASRTINYSPLTPSKSKTKPRRHQNSRSKITMTANKKMKKSSSQVSSRNKNSKTGSSGGNSISTENDRSILSNHKHGLGSLKSKAQDPKLINQYLQNTVGQSSNSHEISYPVLVNYLKEIINLTRSSIETLKKSISKQREEPTVREFRKIQAVFNSIESIETEHEVNLLIMLVEPRVRG